MFLIAEVDSEYEGMFVLSLLKNALFSCHCATILHLMCLPFTSCARGLPISAMRASCILPASGASSPNTSLHSSSFSHSSSLDSLRSARHGDSSASAREPHASVAFSSVVSEYSVSESFPLRSADALANGVDGTSVDNHDAATDGCRSPPVSSPSSPLRGGASDAAGLFSRLDSQPREHRNQPPSFRPSRRRASSNSADAVAFADHSLADDDDDISTSLYFKHARVRTLVAGETLFSAGDAARSFFVLASGRMCAVGSSSSSSSSSSSGGVVADIEAGHNSPMIVGGMSFYGRVVRGETIRCAASTGGAVVLEIDEEAFFQMTLEQPLHLLRLSQVVARQLAPVCQSFVDLGLQIISCRAGELLCEQDQPADSLALFINGRGRLFVTGQDAVTNATAGSAAGAGAGSDDLDESGSGAAGSASGAESASGSLPERFGSGAGTADLASTHHRFVVELGRGETLGEVSFLGGKVTPRSFSAVSVRDSELVVFSRSAFQNLLALRPECMMLFSQALTQRLQRLLERRALNSAGAQSDAGGGGGTFGSKPQQSFTTIAVVPASDSVNQCQLHAFAEQLRSQLQVIGPTLLLDSRTATEAIFGRRRQQQQRQQRQYQHDDDDCACRDAGQYQYDAASERAPAAARQRVRAASPASSLQRKAMQRAADAAKIVQWLTEQEEHYQFLVFEVDCLPPLDNASGSVGVDTGANDAYDDDDDTEGVVRRTLTLWSKCCVRQSDGVLLVASAADSPSVSRYERLLVWQTHDLLGGMRHGLSFQSQKDLVLLHNHQSSLQLPTNTKAWLDVRPVRMHHHVRLTAASASFAPAASALSTSVSPSSNSPSIVTSAGGTRVECHLGDVARVARFCAGRAVGVVLGGGGAKGCAHIGVLRAFEEEGVPIDYIGGTSQGAFMAALYASTLSSTGMRQPLEQFCFAFTLTGILRSLTLPVLSYFHGSAFTDIVRAPFGHTSCIEDLWIPYFCVTTNMCHADTQAFSRGLLWWHVRASMSILGFVPPMIDDLTGDLHIDGGYANNLPVPLPDPCILEFLSGFLSCIYGDLCVCFRSMCCVRRRTVLKQLSQSMSKARTSAPCSRFTTMATASRVGS